MENKDGGVGGIPGGMNKSDKVSAMRKTKTREAESSKYMTQKDRLDLSASTALRGHMGIWTTRLNFELQNHT